ncbi:hydroxymethylglutaryl-CoA synthase family protein [Burkholderia ubonensis]|uniref:hydroxymethylglutaryl-CoA synthase family protein n=1 Tax=Burkholderia ubonensis TaxID=101571 RepID=UPI0035902BD3
MSEVGIEKLNVYAGVAAIDVAELFRGRGLDPERIGNIQQDRRSLGLGFEDPVTSAVNAAKPIIDQLGEAAGRIEMLIVSSESGVDYSKSLASYVHRYLGLGPHCRFLEVKQACYGATAALQMALGYLGSGVSPGGKALVIATDISLVDARAGYAEPSTGFGAVAMLLGQAPEVLTIDRGAFGLYSYETMDSARPLPTQDIADVDKSLFAYLDCLGNSFKDYQSRVPEADFVTTFGQLCMHTPFAGIVQAAHRKMMRDVARLSDPAVLRDDFACRLQPSLVYPRQVGNMCSGSLYLALASLIENRDGDAPVRVGLYAYGSGCSSEFLSGVVDARSRAALAPFAIADALAARTLVSFEQYEALLRTTLGAIAPVSSRTVRIEDDIPLLPARRPRLLALARIADYERHYEWI